MPTDQKDLYCDNCGAVVYIRGIVEPEFVHRTGSAFCMTTVATVNGVKYLKRENDLAAQLQEASVDDHGIPVPAVMEKIIDKFTPAPASYPVPPQKTDHRCSCGDYSHNSYRGGTCGPNGCYNRPA